MSDVFYLHNLNYQRLFTGQEIAATSRKLPPHIHVYMKYWPISVIRNFVVHFRLHKITIIINTKSCKTTQTNPFFDQLFNLHQFSCISLLQSSWKHKPDTQGLLKFIWASKNCLKGSPMGKWKNYNKNLLWIEIILKYV